MSTDASAPPKSSVFEDEGADKTDDATVDQDKQDSLLDDTNANDEPTNEDGEITFEESTEGYRWMNLLIPLLAFAHLAFAGYYFGYVFSVLKFMDRYTGWANFPPPLPRISQPWVDWQFYVVWATVFSVISPIALLFAQSDLASRFRADVMRYAAFVAMLCTGGPLLGLIVLWILSNGAWFPFNIFNSVDFCCKFYGSVAGTGRCQNINDCADAPSATVSLFASPESLQLLGGALISLGFLALEFLFIYMARNYASSMYGRVIKSYTRYKLAIRGIPTLVWIPIVVFVIGYIVLYIAYAGSGLLSIDIRYTHEYPANAPLGIQSARTFGNLFGLIVSGFVILIPALLVFAIGSAGRFYRSLFTIIVMGCITIAHFVALFSIIYIRGSANIPGNPNNIANSPLYCCAADVRAVPSSQCDNLGPCTLPAGQLPPASSLELDTHPTYWVILSFNAAFAAFNVVMMGAAILVSFWGTLKLSQNRIISGLAKRSEDFLDEIAGKVQGVGAKTASTPKPYQFAQTSTRQRKTKFTAMGGRTDIEVV